jgi:hypothetical protein
MDMKKFILVVSLSLLVLCLLAGCHKNSSDVVKSANNSDWVINYTDTNGDVIFYKIENRVNDVVQLWEKLVFSDEGRKEFIQDRKENGLSVEGMDKLEHFNTLHEINCNEKTGRVLSVVTYDTDGKIISSSVVETKWEYIGPDSIGDSFRKKVCK